MYEIIKNVITAGGYKLGEIQRKVKKLYVWGDLTEAQADELLAMAAAGVSADAERPEVMAMLLSLAGRVAALEAAQRPGEGGSTENTEAWTPWDGISDKYQKGAIVTHNGITWESVFNGQNVWEPGAVGTKTLWVKREEE
jgi:hypothetical protein